MSIYKQRIIGYVDILGWTNACNDLSQQTNVIQAAESIKKHAENFSPLTKDYFESQSKKDYFIKIAGYSSHTESSEKFNEYASIEFSFFSDNFAVSAPVEHAKWVFGILSWASLALLHTNFLVRGAVTLGDLYHEKNVIFGPALIEAVNMEKKVNYPRLICSKKLVEFLNKTDYKDKVVLRDDRHQDDWIVNITTALADSDSSETEKSYVLDNFNRIVNDNISKLEKCAEKWQYFQEILPIMYKTANIIN